MPGVLPTEHLHFAYRCVWCPTFMPGECVGLPLHLRDPEVISQKTCLQITVPMMLWVFCPSTTLVLLQVSHLSSAEADLSFQSWTNGQQDGGEDSKAREIQQDADRDSYVKEVQ